MCIGLLRMRGVRRDGARTGDHPLYVGTANLRTEASRRIKDGAIEKRMHGRVRSKRVPMSRYVNQPQGFRRPERDPHCQLFACAGDLLPPMRSSLSVTFASWQAGPGRNSGERANTAASPRRHLLEKSSDRLGRFRPRRRRALCDGRVPYRGGPVMTSTDIGSIWLNSSSPLGA
jgi:hypothetical protein